ncbi:MAG TPA: hypothetical protein VF725_09135 [Ktedonobacterales bacterium]
MAKRIALITLVPVLLALVVAAALLLRPSNAAAQSLVPFHATVSETFTAAPCGPMSRCITAVGQGQADHLGDISEHALIVVDTNPADLHNGCAPETRATTLTAANGDVLTLYGTGWTCAATSDAHDNFAITGGSGRFQGAYGSGNEYNAHTFTGPGVGIATVAYDGDMSSVGSLQS